MSFPITTGAVAKLLGIPEPKLNDQIRRGRLAAPKQTASGRRLWSREEVVAAASALNVALPIDWDEADRNDQPVLGGRVDGGAR